MIRVTLRMGPDSKWSYAGRVSVSERCLTIPGRFVCAPAPPRGEALKLCRPIYRRTAAYGHFGRAPEADGGFSWERTDLVEAPKKAV